MNSEVTHTLNCDYYFFGRWKDGFATAVSQTMSINLFQME
jgi:hypothetical protein